MQNTVDRLIRDVYAGKIHPRVAAGLAALLSLRLRTIEATDLEGQVAALRRRLAEAQERSKPTGKAERPIEEVLESLVATNNRILHKIRLRQSRALAGPSSSWEPLDDSYYARLPGGIEGMGITNLRAIQTLEEARSGVAGSNSGGKG